MQNVLLDFELTDEQLEALSMHQRFKNAHCYERLESEDLSDVEKIQIWFSCSYNDNTYDVTPIYADLITNGKVVNKVKLTTYSEIEIRDYDGDEGTMLSFTVTPKML